MVTVAYVYNFFVIKTVHYQTRFCKISLNALFKTSVSDEYFCPPAVLCRVWSGTNSLQSLSETKIAVKKLFPITAVNVVSLLTNLRLLIMTEYHHLLVHLKRLCSKQCGPRPDCSSSRIWIHTVCLYAEISLRRKH